MPATPRLVISDDGPGTSDKLRKLLFQPFSAGQSLSGSGLGLAICLEITHALGGQIELVNRSAHGLVKGLDSTVCLPLVHSVNEGSAIFATNR